MYPSTLPASASEIHPRSTPATGGSLSPASDDEIRRQSAPSSVSRTKPQLYPQAVTRDLRAALDTVEQIAPADTASRRMLWFAGDWLAQMIRDLACAHASEGHTDEFTDTLGDVVALLQGVIALHRQAGIRGCIPLASAAALIERAVDTLAQAEGGAA